ncbi:MAG: selenium-dependent molybdenum cofactor biosynthesis protein YqeB [Tepidibacter sp.]|jgi:xanthine dehydrogenase accessory factor|uniref:selenium-dependent molybdenum cofactor biosynthesis protein YqeB n=1 Tax=Tepidibacter sp. TaxID=2529387 RepID=UPI0025FB1EDF|nr:selenium-dependent molybdenum cofactor biosynthesis protein YqeB [Tepidibacter sp.]MCT4509636.1 selenium-dependent molybdenum cofactor biosynthesis protein YqeB [Tepidibacter sp.]
MVENVVVIRGGGDIATGIAHKLHRSGFKVLILEVEKPTMVRRTVSFASAVFDCEVVIEDVKSVKVYNAKDIYKIWNDDNIPVIVDPKCSVINEIKLDILVDATLAKKNLGMNKEMASITIGVGPGFNAGHDVDVVVETIRGHDLGRLIFRGYAKANTGIPGKILGYDKERVLRAPCNGIIKNLSDIGDNIKKNQIIAYVENKPVKASIDGVLRGMIMNNSEVKEGLKIADIDPRGIKKYCFTISDKARSVSGGVLEAILYMKKTRRECE